ncbi:hypothetical protein HYH02_012760 [Chlamydomonas schloesseri]|uniref:Glutathione S-transferase n=1 Tax=Chlamydomonas schloesseri TaxID=2026947 RepID=A0A835T7M1_9CHLO|nr:hypothetical protein HYH02_012760 [Chlamydomonas schloesseri]|eukprot:KAG2433056.1 hypothetical protein HYH02_012760 [Chlamydomonas schloesseri]
MFKIHYFPAPGRAEVSRLCLTLGGIPYEDVHYTGATFAEAKAKFPFAQVPVLEFPDGKMLAQSGAIDRYTAKLAGLYPEDPLQVAFADQAVFLLNDFTDLFTSTYSLPLEDKIKARQEILAGKGGEKLKMLEKLVASAGGGYLAGDKLSFADLTLFVSFSTMICGQLDGMPKDLLKDYPALQAFRNKIAAEPGVKAYYDKHSDGFRAAFKPDA